MAYQQGDTPLPRQRRPQPTAQPMPQTGQADPAELAKMRKGAGISNRQVNKWNKDRIQYAADRLPAPTFNGQPVQMTPEQKKMLGQKYTVKSGGGLQAPPNPRATPMPGQGGAERPRFDARSKINELPGLGAAQREQLIRAANRGSGALRDAVRGQPWEQDVMKAFAGAAGAAQNPMGGARPASGGGVPGITSGVVSFEGEPQAPVDPTYAASVIKPMQGAPAQPGSSTALPTPSPIGGAPVAAPASGGIVAGDQANSGGFAPVSVPQGAITSVWNPQAREKMAAERGWGFVQQVQDAMTKATQGLPEGTGQRQQAIYQILQQFGLAGGGQGVPQGQPPGQRPVTQTPPINPLPPFPEPSQRPPITQTPPIYIPPSVPPQADPPIQNPDIFLPF